MNGKRRPEYLYLSLGTALAGIVITVLAIIIMNSCSSPFRSGPDNREKQIITRASSLAGNPEDTCATRRVGADLYSISDYLITVFESPEYLASCSGDEQFASDLADVVYGDGAGQRIAEISSLARDNTRMYVIDHVMRDVKKSYKATGGIPGSGRNGSVADAVVTDDFKSDGRILMGISKAAGTVKYAGNDIRADILVDGSLCHGYLNLKDGPSGSKAFDISWDTAESGPGEHDISILFRTGEGISLVIHGGKVDIPEFETITNDRASEGIIKAGSDSSWYRFNCEDRDAYVNFAGMTDDIKVSLFDLYGNMIGENDLPGLSYEVLRGKAQDISEASRQTGIEGLSNCFYVRVQRGSSCTTSDDISFMMVQSRETARYNGTYMAVTGKEGDIVRLVDKDLQIYEDNESKVDILPLNGTLCDLSVKDNAGSMINIWPGFDPKTNEYAYYMKSSSHIRVSAAPQEGYAAGIDIRMDGKSGVNAGSDTEFELKEGMNELSCSVESFSGDKKDYKIYILCGDDDSSFYENTLSKFPQSYYSGLILLHIQHPQYVFTPYDTGLDFEEVVKVEDTGGRSLATNRYNPTYVKPDSKIYDAPDWMAVKPEVIRYYLDPRNFLSIERVFMFERQSYNPEYHTKDGISSMISGTFMDTDEYNYTDAILNAAKTSGVSPYLLASRILTEMGSSGQSKLAQGTVEGYEGYYNFYNIGSYGSTSDGGPVLNGAKYARWGYEPDKQELTDKEKSYLLPWDSKDKAITGGALWIAAGYINNGQDTLYFQKFDVVDNGTALYDHQYAGNIMMAYSEGYRYYKSYLNTDQLDNTFEFIIPIYSNMPDSYGVKP